MDKQLIAKNIRNFLKYHFSSSYYHFYLLERKNPLSEILVLRLKESDSDIIYSLEFTLDDLLKSDVSIAEWFDNKVEESVENFNKFKELAYQKPFSMEIDKENEVFEIMNSKFEIYKKLGQDFAGDFSSSFDRKAGKTTAMVYLALENNLTLLVPTLSRKLYLRREYKDLDVAVLKDEKSLDYLDKRKVYLLDDVDFNLAYSSASKGYKLFGIVASV